MVALFDHLTATADPSARQLVPAEVRRLGDDPALVETVRLGDLVELLAGLQLLSAAPARS